MKPPRFVVLTYLIQSVDLEGWVCVYVGDDRASIERVAARERARGREVVVSPVTPEEAPTS